MDMNVLFYAGHSAGHWEDKRHGLYSKGALFKETVTQRTTNFLKRQKGKVQDAVRTRNREKNWSSLGSQRRICWGSDIKAEIWMAAIHIYVKTGLHKMQGLLQ